MRAQRKLGRQARLADPGVPPHQRDATGSRAGPLIEVQHPREVGFAAHEHVALAGRERRGQRKRRERGRLPGNLRGRQRAIDAGQVQRAQLAQSRPCDDGRAHGRRGQDLARSGIVTQTPRHVDRDSRALVVVANRLAAVQGGPDRQPPARDAGVVALHRLLHLDRAADGGSRALEDREQPAVHLAARVRAVCRDGLTHEAPPGSATLLGPIGRKLSGVEVGEQQRHGARADRQWILLVALGDVPLLAQQPLVQRPQPRARRRPQLRLQQPANLVEHGEGLRHPAALGERLHEIAIPGLAQGRGRDQPSRRTLGDRQLRSSGSQAARGEAFERSQAKLLELAALVLDP